MKIAGSLARLGTEGAFEVLSRAKALEASGRRIIHLEIGEPDFPTPEHVVEAGVRALREGYTNYCPAPGLPELREAVAAYITRSRGVAASPERVVITPGAKPLLFFSVLATCEPGDEVIYPDPGFPIYKSVIEWAGATPVPLPLREETGFTFDPEDLAALMTERTRLVMLNFPGNPTGGALDDAAADHVADVLADHRCWVLSDEIYGELRYDAQHTTIASRAGLADRTIVLDGFSKTFAMTGWRLGYALFPEPLVEPITRLIINSVSCTAPAVQCAGVAALEGSWEPVLRMRAVFRERRDLVVAGLNALPGVTCTEPQGAFYVFPNISGTGCDATDLADLLLSEAGVAVLSGHGFGAQGASHLRLSYAASTDDLTEAIDKMGDLLTDMDRFRS